MLTFLYTRRGLGSEIIFIERPPLKILFVAPTIHISLMTLQARWLRLVALQSFGLARYTS